LGLRHAAFAPKPHCWRLHAQADLSAVTCPRNARFYFEPLRLRSRAQGEALSVTSSSGCGPHAQEAWREKHVREESAWKETRDGACGEERNAESMHSFRFPRRSPGCCTCGPLRYLSAVSAGIFLLPPPVSASACAEAFSLRRGAGGWMEPFRLHPSRDHAEIVTKPVPFQAASRAGARRPGGSPVSIRRAVRSNINQDHAVRSLFWSSACFSGGVCVCRPSPHLHAYPPPHFVLMQAGPPRL